MTPTTAAVIAERARVQSAYASQLFHIRRAEEIQRKHGANVTHVASRPPSVPARSGDNAPGCRNAAMKPDELQHHDQRARCCLGHAEAVEHFTGFEPAVVLDRLLGNVSEHSVSTAKGHHRHLAEEKHRDLAKYAVSSESKEKTATGTSQSDSHRGDGKRVQLRTRMIRYLVPKKTVRPRTRSVRAWPQRRQEFGRREVSGETQQPGRSDDKRERYRKKEDDDERDGRERDQQRRY